MNFHIYKKKKERKKKEKQTNKQTQTSKSWSSLPIGDIFLSRKVHQTSDRHTASRRCLASAMLRIEDEWPAPDDIPQLSDG
jgi:hypothetical protein